MDASCESLSRFTSDSCEFLIDHWCAAGGDPVGRIEMTVSAQILNALFASLSTVRRHHFVCQTRGNQML